HLERGEQQCEFDELSRAGIITMGKRLGYWFRVIHSFPAPRCRKSKTTSLRKQTSFALHYVESRAVTAICSGRSSRTQSIPARSLGLCSHRLTGTLVCAVIAALAWAATLPIVDWCRSAKVDVAGATCRLTRWPVRSYFASNSITRS